MWRLERKGCLSWVVMRGGGSGHWAQVPWEGQSRGASKGHLLMRRCSEQHKGRGPEPSEPGSGKTKKWGLILVKTQDTEL